MTIFLIILSCLLWLGAIMLLFRREMVSPALSFLALFLLSLAPGEPGRALLPINSTIITSWLCMALVVTMASWMQPEPIKAQHRGIGYMTVGAAAGLALGLLGFSFSVNMSMLYASMIVGVCIGLFLGYLLFTRTPDGQALAAGNARFFRYLLAKGFPVAITVMIPGVVLILILAIFNNIVAY